MLVDPHPSHVISMSCSSSCLSICINCGLIEQKSGGWDKRAAEPCPTPVGASGKTLEEHEEGERIVSSHLKSLPFDFDDSDDE